MIVTNTETIVGYEIIETKGIVQGNTVRAKHVGRDIAAGLKNLVGGELKGYTELLTESRREAMQRMLAQAQQLGANAVVGIDLDYETFAFTDGSGSWGATQPNWTAFVNELAAALHAQGKLLAVTIPPPCSTGGSCSGAAELYVYGTAVVVQPSS